MEVIISGATRGLGKTLAKFFSKEDNHLHLIARSKSDLKTLKEEIKSSNNQVNIYPIDLGNKEEIDALSFNFSKKKVVLINNLGIYAMDKPSTISEENLHEQFNINLFSAIRLSKKVLPQMKENANGRIVNIGSVMSLNASSIATSYSISKHALKAWTDALREEVKEDNILVSGVYPGSINTSSWDGLGADRKAMIQTEDIAELIGCLTILGNSTLVEEIIISPRDFEA